MKIRLDEKTFARVKLAFSGNMKGVIAESMLLMKPLVVGL